MWKKWLRQWLHQWLRRLLGQDEERSVIGPGLQIRGPITGVGELEIRGRVEGDIVHSGRLIIAAGALCLGSIQTDELRLAGEVHGHVEARDKLELMETGRLYGDTVCGSLQIHPGASFQGTNRMAEGLLPGPRWTASAPAPATPALAILREPIRPEEPPPPWVQELFEPAPEEEAAVAWADEPAATADGPSAQPDGPAAPADEPPAPAQAEPTLLPPEIPAFQGGFGPVPAVRNTG
jgi:cytoskeletal protein CcmA (bactofilin family)